MVNTPARHWIPEEYILHRRPCSHPVCLRYKYHQLRINRDQLRAQAILVNLGLPVSHPVTRLRRSHHHACLQLYMRAQRAAMRAAEISTDEDEDSDATVPYTYEDEAHSAPQEFSTPPPTRAVTPQAPRRIRTPGAQLMEDAEAQRRLDFF